MPVLLWKKLGDEERHRVEKENRKENKECRKG